MCVLWTPSPALAQEVAPAAPVVSVVPGSIGAASLGVSFALPVGMAGPSTLAAPRLSVPTLAVPVPAPEPRARAWGAAVAPARLLDLGLAPSRIGAVQGGSGGALLSPPAADGASAGLEDLAAGLPEGGARAGVRSFAKALSARGTDAGPDAVGALYDGSRAAREEPAAGAVPTADGEILSVGEKVAQGITGDEGLKLVPWEPLWAGDRPTWRLIKEGGHLRIQYVPEDLAHAGQGGAMARLMQEVFRAVYSRPDLIEPDLRSDGLFETLYDTMETGRVVKKGLKERPGLGRDFNSFYEGQYRDIEGDGAARMRDLPSYLRFLEGALYESRQGREDPRVKDPRVLEALRKTRPLREKVAAASAEEAYKLSRELWPTLKELHEDSESEAMSQKMFEKMGQEGKLGPDQERNSAAGQGRLKLDDLDGRQREEVQKQIEKRLQELTPEHREELRKQIRERMRQQEQAFRKTMGKSQPSEQQDRRTDAITRQLEQAASRLAQEAAQAKSQAQDLEEKASQMQAQTGARATNPQDTQEFDAQAGRLHQQADRLDQAAREFRHMAEQLKRGASSSAAEKTMEQARQLDGMGKDLQDQSRQLQSQTEALKKQLEQGQGREASSLREKAASVEEASRGVAEKAGKIQEEAQNAQALSEALGKQLKGSRGSQGRPGQESQPHGGQEDLLGQMLKAWARQKSSGSSGKAGEAGDSQGQGRGGEMNPSGSRGTSESIGNIEEEIQKAKSGGLDAGQRRWLEEYLEPVRGMIDTLAYKIRKHIKAAALGRELTGLFAGDVDENALAYYKAKVGIMKEELLPGRPKARITILLDLSGSMGRIEGGESLDHAARALLMALKAFRQAFKNERGVEVRVVAYNENPQLPVIGDYMQVKDLSDAVLYRAVERINEIQTTCRGDNCGVRMMDRGVRDIRDDMKGHADTTYALLHIGDGDPGAHIAAEIRAIYDDPANARIRFANLAAGPRASDMYEKYQPYSFWAQELAELGTKWAEIVEATFKKAWSAKR